MPKSNFGGKSGTKKILAKLHEIRPLSLIVDIGPGVGTYTKYRQPGQSWIGVEAWAPYIKMFELEKKYDQVIVADVRYLDWRTLEPIDVVIFGDILEHMAKEEALVVLDKALTAGRIVIVSLPVIHAEQGEIYDNPFETHVEEDWTHEDALAAFSDWCVSVRESYIGVYVLSRQVQDRKTLIEIGNILADELRSTNQAGAEGGPVEIFTNTAVA